jgi:hypothetical protein
LVTAHFVALGSREVGDEHSCTGTSEGLLDVMEEFDFANAIKAEEAVDQQDWILSSCIP